MYEVFLLCIKNKIIFKKKMIKYSIITPVFNREDCIERCINSVLIQESSAFSIEHIIVDDGSSDETCNIVQTYADRFQNIKFIQFKKNRGTNAARNAAISAATGDFCIILDSDDYFVDNAINIINCTVLSNSSYKYFMFAPDDVSELYHHLPVLKVSPASLSFQQVIQNNVFCDFIHVISTGMLKKYPFDESLRIYEGVFFLRFYKAAQKMFFTNEIVVIRERSRTDSVTREFFQTDKSSILKSLRASELKLKWFEDDYRKYAPKRLINIYLYMFDCYLRMNDYKNCKFIYGKLEEMKVHLPIKLHFIYSTKMGQVYYLLRKYYLIVKYDVLKSKLK